MLLSGIVADHEYRLGRADVAHAGRTTSCAGKRSDEAGIIGGAVMIDVVGAEHAARELLQQIVLFVSGASRSDYPGGSTGFLEFLGNQIDGCFPGRLFQLAVLAD